MTSSATEVSAQTKPVSDPARTPRIITPLIVLLAGVGAGMNLTVGAISGDAGIAWSTFVVYLIAGLVVYGGVWLAIHSAIHRALAGVDSRTLARYARLEPLAYLPAMVTLLGIAGLHVPWMLILLAVLAANGAAVYVSLDRPRRREVGTSQGWLAFLFLVSGFAALIYQIAWQRTLFTIYGVNMESITIIVALFMFGLGVGSFVGGLAARKWPRRAAELFLVCELGIGLFGLVSLSLIETVGGATLSLSLPAVSLVIFALLATPTFLMGATLPILVSHVYRYYRNVGESVGLLYAINTVGSAIACFLTAELLFILAGLHASVYVAATCNVIVGLLVWRYARALARKNQTDAASLPAPTDEPAQAEAPAASSRLAGWALLILAGAVGYISLSQEIVWMRLISYMTGGRPAVFARVLGCFLLGVAAGAMLGKRLCRKRGDRSVLGVIAAMLLISGAFYYASIVATAYLASVNHALAVGLVHAIIAVVSLLLGGIFPLVCHEAAQAGRSVGLTVSRVYVANIVGSTLGPLVTGFVLMDIMSSREIILSLSLAAAILGGVVGLASRPRRLASGAVAAGLVAVLVLVHGPAMGDLFVGLHRPDGHELEQFVAEFETRSGVITVADDPGGDIVYGGGIYDGRFSIDPVINSNLIRRCYWIAALHPEPTEVLEVGLSTGSWARVLADYPPIEELTIVEINPGYLDLIGQYPDQAALLDDPDVTIHIDDGRRWLARHPDRKFDLMVQNTTFHWRSHATGLLSREYLELCKSRLKPGGVIYLNTTWSDDVYYTAASVFKHVLKYVNFVAMSDEPFDLTDEQIRENLLKFVHDGQVVFESSDEAGEVLEELATIQRTDIGPRLRDREDLILITDDNMATEYKRGQWVHLDWSWAEVFHRLGR